MSGKDNVVEKMPVFFILPAMIVPGPLIEGVPGHGPGDGQDKFKMHFM